MAFEYGSVWRKWDLHVHTPLSIVNSYAGSQEQAWEDFLADIEQLPPAFAVLGISDYFFLDGYERLLEEKKHGRLPGVQLLLPVIELRLKAFGGTDSHLSKVNAHVIFSEELSPRTIETQFFGALATSVQLTPNSDKVDWKAVLTRESLEDLGRSIIQSVPADRRAKFGTPLIEGFNNITFNWEDVLQALDSHYFLGKYILAVGKTEWADIKWKTQSIADKKTLINRAQMVFIASPSPEHFKRAKEKLRKEGVNDHLIDCSDAHYLSSSSEKDRIGNCMTWIKADPSFQGLRQALVEWDERVFVGDEPEKLSRLREEPQYFLESVSLSKSAQSPLSERWFENIQLTLNPGLVSVIGNKGMGKSALVEAIAIASACKLEKKYFSFLTDARFLAPRERKGRHFSVTVRRQSGDERSCRFDETPFVQEGEWVSFLPQGFLEVLCADPESIELFSAQLDEVVFSHVPESDRLGQASLGELVQHLTAETERQLDRLRLKLSDVNREIASLEGRLTKESREGVARLYLAKRRELIRHRAQRPGRVAAPAEDAELSQAIVKKRGQVSVVQEQIDETGKQLNAAKGKAAAVETVREVLENLEREVENRLDLLQKDLEVLGLKAEDIVVLEIDWNPIQTVETENEKRIRDLQGRLHPEVEGSLKSRSAMLRQELLQLREQLDEPARLYQLYLEAEASWKKKRAEIIGKSNVPGSLLHVRSAKYALESSLPERLAGLKRLREEQTTEIFESIVQLRKVYEKLHQPVQDFIRKNPQISQELDLRFDVSIVPEQFVERFVSFIHQGRRGSFQGVHQGRELTQKLIGQFDFSQAVGVLEFCEEILTQLLVESNSGAAMCVADQLVEGRTPQELYDFVFGLGYLTPRYVMRIGGRELSSLSPGERGLILLVFYLLVSKDSKPLIVDQPELNLDNETVFKVLVPVIRLAKKSRQVIIVTHNPNLAVVCDSEQIIRAIINKEEGNRVEYIAGSIESPRINRWLVDVLEGTWPAFDKRQKRYYPE